MDEIKQSKNKILIPTIIGGVVLIVVILAIVLLAGNGSKKVVNKFAKGLEKQNATKMCAAINSDLLENHDIDDDCEEYFDEVDIKFKNVEIGSAKKMDKDDVEALVHCVSLMN